MLANLDPVDRRAVTQHMAGRDNAHKFDQVFNVGAAQKEFPVGLNLRRFWKAPDALDFIACINESFKFG